MQIQASRIGYAPTARATGEAPASPPQPQDTVANLPNYTAQPKSDPRLVRVTTDVGKVLGATGRGAFYGFSFGMIGAFAVGGAGWLVGGLASALGAPGLGPALKFGGAALGGLAAGGMGVAKGGPEGWHRGGQFGRKLGYHMLGQEVPKG